MKLKHMTRLALSLALAAALGGSALASPVPKDLVTENLNGQQRMVKTYELPPDTDPDTLKEPAFDYEGFTYTWAYTTQEEHPFRESKSAVETVTVETPKKDLSTLLEYLPPTVPYDDGTFTGELALDHTSIVTIVAGYKTQYGTVTDTKTIGPLDRNDMSYVPATTVKNGVTLSLANVQWQVIGTDLVGETLAPSVYQAVATYSAPTSYQVPTGYITTADYKGEVTSEGVGSVTYTVVYAGKEIVPEPEEPTAPFGPDTPYFAIPVGTVVAVLLVLLAAGLAGAGIYFFLHRKNVCIYVPGDRPQDYKLVGKFRVQPDAPEVDITGLEPYPESIIAVEIKRPLAKKLLNQTFTVHHRAGDETYTVLQDRPGDWYEFDPAAQIKEDAI